MLSRQCVDVDLGKLVRKTCQGASHCILLQRADEKMTSPHLCLAEEQRRVVPAALEHHLHLVRYFGYLGLVGPQCPDRVADIHQELGAIEPEVIGGKREVAALV